MMCMAGSAMRARLAARSLTVVTCSVALAACGAMGGTGGGGPDGEGAKAGGGGKASGPAVGPAAARAAPGDLAIVTLDSPAPMIAFKIQVKAGSAHDPAGKEGLALLTAQALLEGGFGDPSSPITKERLAEITLPWGDGAIPWAQVSAETTTFHFVVPRAVLPEYIERVLRPLFTAPIFLEKEVDRLKTELSSRISMLRLEDLENLGLAAFDGWVMEGTGYAHQAFGSEESTPRLDAADARRFHSAMYAPSNLVLGVSTGDPRVVDPIAAVLRSLRPAAETVSAPDLRPPPIDGRRCVVVEEPNAPAASIHLGFPISVTRSHPDFWPLYVANTWFGVHRDSFSHLYQVIRQERGYNYGDYSYIEYWSGRPSSLFQVFTQPRTHQYFSIWIRPVAHEHAHHIAKAATYELASLVEHGLTDEQVRQAKVKAKVLYLNLAETVDRLLAARLDDRFYGTSPGFLDGYVERIEAVTAEQVNAAIRRHLQIDRVKYLLVTDSAHASKLAEDLRRDEPAWGKGLADYQIEKRTAADGTVVWHVPEGKLDMIRKDALWAHCPLRLDEVRLVDVKDLFRTGGFPPPGSAIGQR